MRVVTPPGVLALIALVVAIGGVAVGAPGEGGVIKGCANNLRGELRAIDSDESCASNETELVWNQQGPPGIQGPPGQSIAENVQVGEVTHQLKLDSPRSLERYEWPRVKVRERGKKKPKLKLSIGDEPTRVFSTRNGANQAFGFHHIKTLARLVVLPGKYAVTAKAVFLSPAQWTCKLESTSGAPSADWAGTAFGGTVLLMLDVRTRKPAAIELVCQLLTPQLGGPGVSDAAVIRALNVASIWQKPAS